MNNLVKIGEAKNNKKLLGKHSRNLGYSIAELRE